MTKNFFHTLKVAFIHRERYVNRCQAQVSIFEYIETYDNRQRRHSAIGYQIPMTFEQAAQLPVRSCGGGSVYFL
ncbi:MAG: hypothetical protein NPIRA02_42650 [Nitrospirales bacterium]|nr:MAG: hypothetical protein NPIRA02_42650 [Nitrospirales bacterium]